MVAGAGRHDIVLDEELDHRQLGFDVGDRHSAVVLLGTGRIVERRTGGYRAVGIGGDDPPAQHFTRIKTDIIGGNHSGVDMITGGCVAVRAIVVHCGQRFGSKHHAISDLHGADRIQTRIDCGGYGQRLTGRTAGRLGNLVRHVGNVGAEISFSRAVYRAGRGRKAVLLAITYCYLGRSDGKIVEI